LIRDNAQKKTLKKKSKKEEMSCAVLWQKMLIYTRWLMLYLQKFIKYIHNNTWKHYFTHIIKTLSTSGNYHSLIHSLHHSYHSHSALTGLLW